MQTQSWYAPLAVLESKGSQINPVGGLAGLAAAREQHLGQFFTPLSVVRFMWQIAGLADAPEPETTYSERGRWQLFDNSFGSGRMFAFADPNTHALHGVEVDSVAGQRVIDAAEAAKFKGHLHLASMVDVTLAEGSRNPYGYGRQRFHVGLINPPFSLHFDSPHVAKWPDIATFGKYGSKSSTVSQKLAVAQALAWCEVVVAVVPRSFADAYLETYIELRHSNSYLRHDLLRLRAVYHLPRSVFRSEGAEVDTSVMLWSETAVSRVHVETLRELPERAPALVQLEYAVSHAMLTSIDAPDAGPAKFGSSDKLARLIAAGKIDAPPSERWVRLSHDGRRITIAASDAATYGRALNFVLDSWTGQTEHRRVKQSLYAGQGKLDVECLLAQPDAFAALDELLNHLALTLSAKATASDSLRGYLRKRVRQHAIDVTPFGHTALVEDGGFADWLAEQRTVIVRFKPDAFTPTVHEFFYTPARMDTCAACEHKVAAEGDDVHCWQCKNTRQVAIDSERVCCEIVRHVRATTAMRSPRREHGRDKEARSERHWEVEYEYVAGHARVVGPCESCGGRPRMMYSQCYSCKGTGHRLAEDDDESTPIAVLTARAVGRWSEAELIERCEFPDFSSLPNEWTSVHKGLAEHFPERHKAALARARRLGIDRWLWSYQLADLCEVSLKRGAVIAWEMGLGKARLAAALCLLGGGKHNLITVETRLIREMEAEFKAIGLPASTWQTITKPEHARNLRQINLISYDKLKSTLPGKARPKPTEEQIAAAKRAGKKLRTRDVRNTFAGLLRRRVHTHVCDEGHLLRSPETQQSRAVHHVSAKGRRYLLTGTPIANYPRDVLWLLQWALGDGTAAQVYGNRFPLMRAENFDDYGSAPRGVDEFREQFVTLQWVTDEFADELQEGAKREVPVIADVPGFRKAVRHVIKRRTSAEPDVARHVRIPVPTREVIPVGWDAAHFDFYYRTAQTFVDWYLAEQERLIKAGERDGNAKAMRLIAILRQLQAVYQAANYPQGGVGGQPEWTSGDTSKQRLAVDTVAQWVGEGHKVIAYSRSPALASLIAVRLRARGIDTVEFHGGIPINKRVDALDKRFREGKAQVLAATKGCLQTGYNLAVASRVLHVDGEWTPSVVQQADARVLRPQQRRDVTIRYLDLRGSIDDYQRQMVDQKGATMAAGLDFGAGPSIGTQFKHIDSLLSAFVKDFQALKRE